MASTPAKNVNSQTIRNRAKNRQLLRQGFLDNLFPLITNPYTGGAAATGGPSQIQILNDLANSFSRYAVYQQTVYDNGASRSSNSRDADVMARQVEQAFNKVLGGSYGGNSGGLVNALNSVFPSVNTADGQMVSFKPSRSMVWLYGPNGGGSGISANGGFAGPLPAKQATLYRQASIMAADSLQVLEGLKPFVPEADLEQVDALRAQVRAEINALVDEFGRVDEPRSDRVNAYLNSLGLHVTQLGRRAFLDNISQVATDDDEAQTAAFSLLKNYTSTLRTIWLAFFNDDRSITNPSLSKLVERATIILPVVAQANVDFKAAMDSVDFPESDRRSVATRFNQLKDLTPTVLGLPISLQQPDMTVYDLTEWMDRFSNNEGPSSLADSGQYGLDFVTDQADTLFWIIAPIIGHFRTTSTTTPSSFGGKTLEQVFLNERVIWSLNNMLTQLDSLAKLAA
jgi:hypothetical protein